VLPFNKRPGRDSRDDAPDGDPSDRALQRSSRAVPPPARSQPRVDRFEEDAAPPPLRPFQASRSDEEVTTFMASPAKKPAAHAFEETGETATALHYVRPPAPSEPEEEDSHTQIRHMPRRGRAAPAVQAQPRGKEPPVVRLDPRAEVSLSMSAAVLDEDHETGANAPDFTVQLGPGPAQIPAPAPVMPPPQVAPAPMVHAQPQPFPVHSAPMPAPSAPHSFSPVTSAPMVSRSQPPMGLAPGASLPPAMRSGLVPAMGGMPPSMQSGPVPSLAPQSHAPFASPAHFSVPPVRPLDPPAMALSTSHAAPKPARVWAMALVGVGAAAALAAFVLRGSPTVAAFVDPSRAPGARATADAVTPAAGQGAQTGPIAQPGQGAQAGQIAPPGQGVQVGVLAAQPAIPVAPPPTAQVAAGQPVQPVNPPIAAPVQPALGSGGVGVAAASPPPPAVAAAPEPKAVSAKPAPPPKPEKPVAAAKPEPKPVATKPEPKPVAVAAAPKPVAAKPEPKEPKAAKKPATAAEKEMKDAADALARAQLEQSL